MTSNGHLKLWFLFSYSRSSSFRREFSGWLTSGRRCGLRGRTAGQQVRSPPLGQVKIRVRPLNKARQPITCVRPPATGHHVYFCRNTFPSALLTMVLHFPIVLTAPFLPDNILSFLLIWFGTILMYLIEFYPSWNYACRYLFGTFDRCSSVAAACRSRW